jgi:hypothetical protein
MRTHVICDVAVLVGCLQLCQAHKQHTYVVRRLRCYAAMPEHRDAVRVFTC